MSRKAVVLAARPEARADCRPGRAVASASEVPASTADTRSDSDLDWSGATSRPAATANDAAHGLHLSPAADHHVGRPIDLLLVAHANRSRMWAPSISVLSGGDRRHAAQPYTQRCRPFSHQRRSRFPRSNSCLSTVTGQDFVALACRPVAVGFVARGHVLVWRCAV